MGGQEKGETRSCDTTQVAPLRAQNANKSVDDLSYSESKWAFSLLQKQTDGVWESPGCRRVSSLKPVARSPPPTAFFGRVDRALLASRVFFYVLDFFYADSEFPTVLAHTAAT